MSYEEPSTIGGRSHRAGTAGASCRTGKEMVVNLLEAVLGVKKVSRRSGGSQGVASTAGTIWDEGGSRG